MGNDYSYSDNAERKRLGYRYDSPTTHKYSNAISSIGLIKPTHPLKTLDDLKRATFKSMERISDFDINKPAADNIMVKNTLVLSKQQYKENREFCDISSKVYKKVDYQWNCVKKVGDYFYVTRNFQEMDYVIMVFADENDVKMLSELVFKVAEQIPNFELILPRKTLKYYEEPSLETGIIISSIVIPQLLKAGIKFGERYIRKTILKKCNGLMYKKLNDELDTSDPDEYILLKYVWEYEFREFLVALNKKLSELGLRYENIIDPPPPKYVEPPPPEYTESEQITPSAPPLSKDTGITPSAPPGKSLD